MEISKTDTAILITDPQSDFLSEDGVTWGLVGNSVTENGTVENLERVLRAAKDVGYEVVISPHYYYPTDHGWQFGGTVEAMMHEIHMFDRTGALTLDGFDGSGADWLERYKPYIEDGKNDRRQSAQGLRAGDERRRAAVAQARYRQGRAGRHVGKPLLGEPPA